MMDGLYLEKSCIDPCVVESFFERIYPARVSVENDSCKHCTVIKVDSANKHGVLLEMIQVLSDLDLVIPKSYICSDGGWFMDVFHVTNQSGNKITDKSEILYIQQALCATRWKSRGAREGFTGRDLKPSRVLAKGSALEITVPDKPGLLSELFAVLADLGCHITSAVAWTHNSRAACIIHVEEKAKGGPITDLACLTNIQEKLQNVIKARYESEEKWSLKLITPVAAGEMHTERRLHQLMLGDVDSETSCSCGSKLVERKDSLHGEFVSIETCKEKGYSVVTVESADRPKLLFDTVCALTDMDYEVFHASIRSRFSTAFQEYYIRHKDGNMLGSKDVRHKLLHCLTAAMDRRGSQGLRLDISATNRTGLLSDVTRVLRECGLSVSNVEVSIKGERATGTFCVSGALGEKINFAEIIETMKKEADATVQVATKSLEISSPLPNINAGRSSGNNIIDEKPVVFSMGNLLWSNLENLSKNFIPLEL